jgi:serine/threonine protein kinase
MKQMVEHIYTSHSQRVRMSALDEIVDGAILKNQVISSALYGTVYRYGIYCVKSYHNKSKGKSIENIDNEAAIMSQIAASGRDFPHIPKYYGLVTRADYTYIITEYIDGVDIYNYIEKNKDDIPENVAVYILRIVAQTLHDLRAINIAHMDISIENILIATTGKVYLIDFGMACSYEHAGMPDRFFGKPMYNELEIQTDPEKRQMYMMGIVLHVLLFRFQPYQEHGDAQHVAFTKSPRTYLLQAERMSLRRVTRPLMNVLHKIVVRDLKYRYTFVELIRALDGLS